MAGPHHNSFKDMMNDVVDYGSCCECGTCVVACPHNVIEYIDGKPKQTAAGGFHQQLVLLVRALPMACVGVGEAAGGLDPPTVRHLQDPEWTTGEPAVIGDHRRLTVLDLPAAVHPTEAWKLHQRLKAGGELLTAGQLLQAFMAD